MTDQPDFSRLRRQRILETSETCDAYELDRSFDAQRTSSEDAAARPEQHQSETAAAVESLAEDGPRRLPLGYEAVLPRSTQRDPKLR